MTFANRAQKEKRDFIRMKVDTPLRAEIAVDGEELTGICRDLSGGGISLESERDFPPDTTMTVTVTGDYGHKPTLRAEARVVRSAPTAEGQYLLGLEIIRLLSSTSSD